MKKIINLIYKKIKENVLIRFSLILLILILINAILKFFN
ncbi:unknown [Clostridium sp. CAG:356]|nr:unknown [Clostridium sp. CAG:356]